MNRERIVVTLNGETRMFEAGTTLMRLLETHHLKVNATLIELNGEAISRREWSEREIHENDQIEFLRVVAGG